MALFSWSQTAAANATADSTINYSEGQAPSSLNDSARAAMAAVAKYRDDISGAIVTGGSSTAYTLSSFSNFDTLAHLGGQMIAFTPHATNGATVTLNVDSLGAKPLRSSPNVELLAGTIVQGTPYMALYNNSDGAFYLQGFLGANPYNIPLGAGLEFWGTTAPNSSFAFPYGQAISRTTYATLFALTSTTYGTGDGSTTFNLPDCRGRVVAGKDDMGGSAAGRLVGSGITGTTLGANGGVPDIIIGTTNLPPYTPTGTVTPNAGGPNPTATAAGSGFAQTSGSGTSVVTGASQNALTTPFVGNPQGGTSAPIVTVPPMIIANRLIRII